MFLSYFGLQDDPFGVTPEPRYLYQSNTHREALASLKFGFYSNRGFTTLIAPPGLGKTTLLHRFLGDIGDSARSVFLFDLDSQCDPRELIRSILRDLGINPADSSTAMHEQLKGVFLEEARRSRIVVVVIDEAQNLSEVALETVRLLSNFETTRAKLIHIVLAGQPQLSEKLSQPSLVQLRQRVTTICRIQPLSAEETHAYINHRLQLAGYKGNSLFSSEAINLIVQASHGIPRMINNLCFNALSICRAMNQKQVSAAMVEEAVGDAQLIPPAKEVAAQPPPSSALFTAPATSREVTAAPAPTAEMLTQPAAKKEIMDVPAPSVEMSAPSAVHEEIVATPASPAEMFQSASKQEGTASARPLKIAGGVLAFLVLTAVGFSGFRMFQDHDVSANTHAVTATPARDVPKPGKASGSDDFSGMKPFQVKAGRRETLRDVAMRYLGDYDETRLRQIRALNPKLTNSSHLYAGENIWLPGPPANAAHNAANSNDARNVP